MARIDADRRQPLRRQAMVEPDRQRARLEHDPLGFGGMFAQHLGNDRGIGSALAAPNPLAIPANADGCLFQRYVETDILIHGCSPLVAWAAVQS